MNITNTHRSHITISLSVVVVYFALFSTLSGLTKEESIEYTPTEEVIIDIEEIPPTPVRGLYDFKYDLGFKESSNRYDAVNPWGYLGRYQFSPNILWRLGFKVDKEVFLNNPQLQEQAFEVLLYHNYDILEDTINAYDGRNVNGVEITESGILAAAHLVGPTRVKIFLKYNENYKDGLGTYLTDYLEEFGGYKLQL